MTEELISRKNTTFEKAEGKEHLPSQLLPQQVSDELRALIWYFVHATIRRDSNSNSLRKYQTLDQPWRGIMLRHWVRRLHQPIDEFDSNFDRQSLRVKSYIYSKDYLKVFGFLQWILRDSETPPQLSANLVLAFKNARAAYRILDEDTIVPLGSEEGAGAVAAAFADLSKHEMHGAKKHLKASAEFIVNGGWADSVRESVHAVESVARSIADGASELGVALTRLERKEIIHPALKKGFGAIYGFTSDEQGIRHPLLDDPEAKVDEADALFMLGACAAFVSYLLHKGRAAGLLTQ